MKWSKFPFPHTYLRSRIYRAWSPPAGSSQSGGDLMSPYSRDSIVIRGMHWLRRGIAASRRQHLFVAVFLLGGTSAADYGIGIATLERGDYVTAAMEFEKAANLGDPEAQTALGLMYGGMLPGLLMDKEKAVELYKIAAAKGIREAMVQLGQSYDYGVGVPANDRLSVEWYRAAAEMGHPLAQNNLGSQYFLGEGVSRDPLAAKEWYERSARQGYAEAQFNIGVLYSNGDDGIPVDLVRGYAWCRLAADQGEQRCLDVVTNWLPRRMSSDDMARAESLAADLKNRIELPTLTPLEDRVLSPEVCVPLPVGKEVIQFVGFSVLRPTGGQWCTAQTGRIDTPDAAHGTMAMFADESTFKFAAIIAAHAQDRRLVDAKNLRKFAKRHDAARRIHGAGWCPGCKFRYTSDSRSDRVCVGYSVDGAWDRQGRRIHGLGRLCVHPHEPSVLVLGVFGGFSVGKFAPDREQALDTEAARFLDSVTFKSMN